jgi:hypothetical protein
MRKISLPSYANAAVQFAPQWRLEPASSGAMMQISANTAEFFAVGFPVLVNADHQG